MVQVLIMVCLMILSVSSTFPLLPLVGAEGRAKVLNGILCLLCLGPRACRTEGWERPSPCTFALDSEETVFLLDFQQVGCISFTFRFISSLRSRGSLYQPSFAYSFGRSGCHSVVFPTTSPGRTKFLGDPEFCSSLLQTFIFADLHSELPMVKSGNQTHCTSTA